jgi:hypothetical protein
LLLFLPVRKAVMLFMLLRWFLNYT